MRDRCDRCGGKPTFRYERGTRRLILCARHARQHGERLRVEGWFAHYLLEQPVPA